MLLARLTRLANYFWLKGLFVLLKSSSCWSSLPHALAIAAICRSDAFDQMHLKRQQKTWHVTECGAPVELQWHFGNAASPGVQGVAK